MHDGPRQKWCNEGSHLAFDGLRAVRGTLDLDVDLPTMSAAQILQHLYSLDTSSPNLSRCLYCLIRSDEEEQYLSTLQGSELTQLVDFLDEVRSSPPASVQLTKPIVQILDAAPMADDVFRRCLHKLKTICSRHAILPSSYTIVGDLARTGNDPVAFGGFSDVWEGTYNGSKVCIKHLRVSEQVRKSIEKVSILRWLVSILPPEKPPSQQAFYKEAIMWKRFRHPNVVAFIGVTRNPLQFVSEWMQNGTLTDYVNENPGANRIGLVRLSSATSTGLTRFLQVVGCGRRSQLPPCKPHNPRRLERGEFSLYAVFSKIDTPWLA